VTGKALPVIEGGLSDEGLMRIVTGDAGNAAIFRIIVITRTLRQTIGLKTHIAGATQIWHCHHFLSAVVAAAAQTLRELISCHICKREDARFG